MNTTLILKRIGLCLVICLGVGLGWYAQSRLLAPFRCIQVVEISTASGPAHNPLSLQFAAYNIAHGRGGDLGASNWTGKSKKEIAEHLEQIAQQVEVSGIDVLVLNEVDFQASWSQNINQARLIATKAGFPYCVEQRNVDVSLPFRQYRFGNAILSRYRIKDVRAIRFPPFSKKESLFAGNHDSMLACITTPIGDINVLAVHLEYRSEDVRVECARVVNKLASESSIPFVAMGDFNSAPSFAKGHRTSKSNENALDILLNSGQLTISSAAVNWKEYLTFPSAHPDRAIDWIMCSPDFAQDSPRIVKSRLSDHLMVAAEISVKMQGSQQVNAEHLSVSRQSPDP